MATLDFSNGFLVAGTILEDGYIQLTQIATPAAPVSGQTRLYSKADGKIYRIPFGGSEVEVGGGGAATGYKTKFIPASQITPRSDTGATPGVYESSTYKVHFETLDFDPDIAQYGQFSFIMDEDWDRSTVKVKFLWMADTGAGNVIWSIQGQALSNDDAIDAAWGTAVSVTDALTALLDNELTDATGAVTIGGTPALADTICFQVYRDATNGSDTFTGPARLLGVLIQYNATLSPSAW
jgi:hypothetical protein